MININKKAFKFVFIEFLKINIFPWIYSFLFNTFFSKTCTFSIDNPDAGKCETKVLLEELKNIRKDQEDAFQLQTEAYEVLQKVLDQLPNKNDVQWTVKTVF